MKHTGKILFGVLSTSALVGTGFAAWIVVYLVHLP